ncbi:hypothetical protein NN561_014463 [Cricetulus griseus]
MPIAKQRARDWRRAAARGGASFLAQETGSGLIFHRKEREVTCRSQTPDAGSACRVKLGQYLAIYCGGRQWCPRRLAGVAGVRGMGVEEMGM